MATQKIQWRNSLPREILLDDLEKRILPLAESELSAEEAWKRCYSHLPEFRLVPFWQFKERLEGHREQLQKKVEKALDDELAFAHDRHLHPRKTTNHRGEKVFDVSSARKLLRKDVTDKVHLQMTPSEFQKWRPEYKDFKPKKFKQHIYQEIRRQKFLYYLTVKRAEKRAKDGLPPIGDVELK